MRERFVAMLVLLVLGAVPASGYVLQLERVRGQVVTLRWTGAQARNGVPYRVNTGSFPFDESDVLRVVRGSFGAWAGVVTASLSFLEQESGEFQVSDRDGRNVIVYDASGSRVGAPPGTGVIAVTWINWNSRGEITDADIVFNGRDFRFSAAEDGPGRGQVDLQDVLTHEIGHLLGLDHTPLVGVPSERPTMNPFNTNEAPGEARSLELDDEAGVAELYPSARALENGVISGRVTHPDGRGSFGVHVVAYRAGTRTLAVSALSGSAGGARGPGGEGAYRISGLPPGDYHVAIEPLGRGITYENFGGIFRTPFDVGFLAEFYDNVSGQQAAQTIRVSAGAEVPGIDFMLGQTPAGFPTLQDLVVPANTPDPNGPYPVEARVVDEEGGVSAGVVYRVDGGVLRTLAFRPVSGDRFRAEIPGQSPGAVVEFRLRARDVDGNETAYPPDDSPMLRFEVIVFSGEPLVYVAARGTGELAVFDTGPQQEVARVSTLGEDPLSVALSQDGRYLFIANTGPDEGPPDNRLTVVETATHRVAAAIEVGTAPLDLATSPDGRRVYVTNSQGRSVSVVDVATLRVVQTLPVSTAGSGPFGVVVSRDGRRVFVTDIDANQVLMLDAQSGALLGRVGVVALPRSLAFSPDGDRLYVAGFGGGISVLDAAAGAVIRTIDTAPAEGVFRVAPSPDGKWLYATDSFGARLLVVDLEQGRVGSAVPTGGRNTRDLAVSEDGRTVYVTGQDSDDLLYFDTVLLRVVRSFKLGARPRGIAVLARPPGQTHTLWDTDLADFDGSGAVDFSDFLLFARGFGVSSSDVVFDARLDLDGNSQVGFSDFLIFVEIFGRVSGSR